MEILLVPYLNKNTIKPFTKMEFWDRMDQK